MGKRISNLETYVIRWHSWNEDRYFNDELRSKVKEDLRLIILDLFNN